ncbi:ferritin-like domain-containing protein [Mucilaginibacter sp.]|uniref:ferritin-like domain-containing protein n=1 Tax=Mucilaginibacter sp. TaxID=1882438 RepID=UPI0025D45C57|nr:ferritin-like domain-containing protein [Mucilaginibacter sp.]
MTQDFFAKGADPVTPDNLGEAIQQAIEIEIATIPTYLYTYYSINRSPDQEAIKTSIIEKLVAKGRPPIEAEEEAIDLSAELVVFANKAGALIMSVAIEEMLHMALSSNLKQALAGMPDLVGKSPVFPATLAGHQPPFPINLAKLSQDQLITFLKIESPTDLPDPRMLKTINYTTIGKFYQMIIDCIQKNDLKYLDGPQLIEGKAFYAQNNIDTVYYDKKHRPHFTNMDDSGDLCHVHDKASAIKAIKCIVDQGEGFDDKGLIQPGDRVNCTALVPGDFDDPEKKELSHFEKFVQIYCTYNSLNDRFKNLDIGVTDMYDYFVVNVADNPKIEHYPANVVPVANLLNAVYTYIFVMIEDCYRQSGNTQWEIFMFGIHKSMIFILNSICGDIMSLKYTHEGKEYVVAPTFNDYKFDGKSRPKAQMIELFNKAVAVFPKIQYLGQRIHDLPDVPNVSSTNSF